MSDAALAPMVRLGTLPLRLLSLERGAALVYSEELVDAKVAASERSVDARLGTTNWRGAGGQIVFRTCAAERGRLVVQLGTADPEGALAASRKLVDPADPTRDGIVQIDVNMGCPTQRWCPKECAGAGGSGSALFADRPRAEKVVAALRSFLPAAIVLSCKIRLCAEGVDATLERCRGLIKAGASALAIHARCATDRPNDPARWAEVAAVVAGLRGCGARLAVNGDALDLAAAQELRDASGCAAVLIARGALLSPSPFAPPPPPEGASSASACAPEGCVCPGCEAEAARREGRCASTLRLCRRYAMLAMACENNPINTGFGAPLWASDPRPAATRDAPGSAQGEKNGRQARSARARRPCASPLPREPNQGSSAICCSRLRAPSSSGTVLQWMIHARLRERAAEPPSPPADPAGLAAAAAALRPATTLEEVAEAVGLGAE